MRIDNPFALSSFPGRNAFLLLVRRYLTSGVIHGGSLDDIVTVFTGKQYILHELKDFSAKLFTSRNKGTV